MKSGQAVKVCTIVSTFLSTAILPSKQNIIGRLHNTLRWMFPGTVFFQILHNNLHNVRNNRYVFCH